MLAAATKKQYSSVLILLRHCLPVFNKFCGMEMDCVFLSSQARNVAGARLGWISKNGQIPDLPEPETKSGTTVGMNNWVDKWEDTADL